MNDRDEQRRKKRELTGCADVDSSLKKDILPSGRPGNKCEDAVAPTAEVFVAPEPCPVTIAPVVSVPEPLELENAEATESCPNTAPKEGPLGDDATIVAGSFVRLFHFTAITGITSSQLSFISTVDAGERTELATVGTTVNRIVEITGLSTSQATELKNAVEALQDEVDTLATAGAYAQLNCFWENEEQTATCDGAALENDDKVSLPEEQWPFINNPSVVDAGTYRSSISQEDADALALDEAEGKLKCLFGNDSRERDCLDLGYSEAITDVDGTPDTLDGQLRKGTYTVAVNTVFSSESVAQANVVADAVADSQLNCFYPNEVVTVTCADEGRVAGTAGVNGPPVGNAVTGARGQSITVPAGFLTSQVGTTDANDAATEYAISLLDCWICNDEIVVECPDQIYVDRDGGNQTNAPSVLSDPIEVTISACLVRSTVSLEDANERATTLGETQLGCIYCNQAIAPECTPEGYETPPVDMGDYDRSTWSVDATAGQAADVFCCQGPSAAQSCYQIAEGVASVPIDVQVNGADCRYGNDEQSASCENDPPSYILLDPPGPTVTMPANIIFVGADAGGKDAANDLIAELVEASISCLYCNQETWGCADGGLGPCTSSTEYWPEGMIPLRQGNVPECSVFSTVDSATATTTAQQLANAGNAWADPEDFSFLGGLPGNDGAQTSCSGNCFGYYSPS
jgi:hypothetical protein